jgi:anti-sigma factor RsiW
VTCRELIELLVDYLEATLPPDTLARLEAHLRACDECRAYLATYRETIALTGRTARVEMPAEMRRRLTTFLLEALQRQ